MTELSNERLKALIANTEEQHLFRGHVSASEADTLFALRELLSLRQSHSTGVVVKTAASCPTCHGTGDHCGNPDFGQCDDCGGTGILQSLDLSDFPPKEAEVTVTDEDVEHHMPEPDFYSDGFQILAKPFNHNGFEARSLFTEQTVRAALVAALSRKG